MATLASLRMPHMLSTIPIRRCTSHVTPPPPHTHIQTHPPLNLISLSLSFILSLLRACDQGSDTSSSDSYECSVLGSASKACTACQAFSIIAIAVGTLGIAASIKVHEIFADYTKGQSALGILGAGVSSAITFIVWKAGVIDKDASDNPLHNADTKESFVLFIISAVLFILSAAALYLSEEIGPVAPR
jgi:hypothetical protein